MRTSLPFKFQCTKLNYNKHDLSVLKNIFNFLVDFLQNTGIPYRTYTLIYMTKIQRNEKCFCGSGLKFKFCHGKIQVSSNANISSIQIPVHKVINSKVITSEEQHYQNTLKLCEKVEEIRSTQPHHILNFFQTGIFNEFGLNDLEVLRIKKIASQIREGVQYVNGGGCGLFALLLQSLVGGEIYHICLAFKLNGEYPFYGDHDFLIYNGICYDSDGACSETILRKYKQPLLPFNSEKELRSPKPTTTYCLYNVTKEEIIEDYNRKEYLTHHCSYEDKVRMVQNAKRLAKKMKNVSIDPEIEKLFPSSSEPKNQETQSFFHLNFLETLLYRVFKLFPSKNTEIDKALANSNFPILNHFYAELKQLSPKIFEDRFSNIKVNLEFDEDTCWNNAMKVTRKYGYRYCEGLLITNSYTFKLHAWNLDNGGNIIDLSINDSIPYKVYNQYFGVVFEPPKALRLYEKSTKYFEDFSDFSGIIFDLKNIKNS